MNPQAVDWDGDGMLDLIVGDRNGGVNYFRRTSDDPVTLTEMPGISSEGTLINVGSNSAPVITDWNDDGLMDLLVGSENPGEIRLYLNQGGSPEPVFSSSTIIQSGSENITHYRNAPQVFDMNGDGRKDILVGANDNNVYFYQNTGTNSDPVFDGCVTIATKSVGMRLWIDDWNEDGLLDMLTSDYDGYVWVWIQAPPGN